MKYFNSPKKIYSTKNVTVNIHETMFAQIKNLCRTIVLVLITFPFTFKQSKNPF